MIGVAEISGWYDPAVYPELRSAPPWVMEDMIEAQVMLPEALSDSLDSSAPQLVEMMHAAADAGEPIVVSAVGTSGHSARAVALILNDAVESRRSRRARPRHASLPTRLWHLAGGACA